MVNDEWKMVWKELAMAKSTFFNLIEGTKENPRKSRRSRALDFNRAFFRFGLP
jgi:hypothetical protein